MGAESSLKADRLFFIYTAKEKDWKQMESEDWLYVSAMTRFFKWWTRRYFDISLPVQADVLPIVPGKLFDRMTVAYLIRDHSERGQDTFHFTLHILSLYLLTATPKVTQHRVLGSRGGRGRQQACQKFSVIGSMQTITALESRMYLHMNF